MIRPQRGETRVFQRSAGSTANNGFSKRLARFDHADTTLQAIADVEGHEDAVTLRKNSFAREHVRNLAMGDAFDDSRPR